MSRSAKSGRRGSDITVRVVRREQPDIAAIRRGILATAIAQLSSSAQPEPDSSSKSGGRHDN